MPLAHVINDKIFVTHEVFFKEDNVTLDDIRNVVRKSRAPRKWHNVGYIVVGSATISWPWSSKRGVGLAFGPDITKQFLDSNGLSMIVRSHEVRDEGYLVEHDGKLVTVLVRQIIVIKWAIKAQLSSSIATANLRTSNLLPFHTHLSDPWHMQGICLAFKCQ